MGKKTYGKKEYIGQISKRKDGSGNYLKITKDFSLKKGQYINLESVADQIKGYEEAAEAKRVTEDYAADQIAKLKESKDKYGLLFTLTYQEVTEAKD